MHINVIGAGLAGCEAAMQIASHGIKVHLYEMKPNKKTPAHHTEKYAELVCSNSLKAMRVESAAGLLKEEMRRLDSFLMKCADACKVPAGGALAVDRDIFSSLATEGIKSCELIEVYEEEVCEIPKDEITVVASGPLTSEPLAEYIRGMFGSSLSFFDAAAPIVTAESIDMEYAFCASRYDKGDGDDYINCPMNKEEYETFYNALISAERAPLHDCDVSNPKVYEGCMPVEVLAKRGIESVRYGCMKPVGLIDPRTDRRPYAVVQLRKENNEGTLYNLVGFQTNLKFGEQKRVFSMITGLQNAEFVRYGVMHRNTFLNSPGLLDKNFRLIDSDNIYFAGQMTGVEGYVESAASGIIAGINLARALDGEKPLELPETCMTAALARHISTENKDFQPMGANMGILPPLPERIKDKKLRYRTIADRGLEDLRNALCEQGITAQR